MKLERDIPIRLYYFTGTGNTFRLAVKIKECFENNNYKVDLVNIEKEEPVDSEEVRHIGLVIPVAIQSTFPIVWRFVNQLPNGKKQKVFMADTMEAYSGGIVGPLKKVFKEKNYQCVGAKEFKMTTSIMKTEAKKTKGETNDISALKAAEDYVNDLIEGKATWGRIGILSEPMAALSKGREIWTSQSKKITVNQEACVMCHWCEKHCPVNAISSDYTIHIDHTVCESCLRCLNFCPKNAFRLGGQVLLQKQTVPKHIFD